MMSYKEMRAALKASPEGVKLRNFTEEFYRTFCEARRAGSWEAMLRTFTSWTDSAIAFFRRFSILPFPAGC